MGVVVFDADVLIGYLNRDDAHHDAALTRLKESLAPGNHRFLSAVSYTEVLVGPLQAAGPAGAEVVDAMLVRFAIETITIDMDLARRAAAVRARTGLKIPDAYTVATAIHAEKRGYEEVRIETFDERVLREYAKLHRTAG